MSYKDVAAQAKNQFSAEEIFVGQFYGYHFPSLWLRLLIGPLGSLLMSHYIVVVSNQKLYFCKLTLFSKLDHMDVFDFSDIKHFVAKSGLLSNHCKFVFQNGKKLTLTTTKHTLRKTDFYFTSETVAFLKAHLK